MPKDNFYSRLRDEEIERIAHNLFKKRRFRNCPEFCAHLVKSVSILIPRGHVYIYLWYRCLKVIKMYNYFEVRQSYEEIEKKIKKYSKPS